jgi:uncharacterized protein YijF (DUF1287 family)
MREEVKDLKQIVKVPRLHYKEIEKIDMDNLKTQFSEYSRREGFFVTDKNIDKEKIRA